METAALMRYRLNRSIIFSLFALGLSLLLWAPAQAECVAKQGSIFFITDREPLDNSQLFSVAVKHEARP